MRFVEGSRSRAGEPMPNLQEIQRHRLTKRAPARFWHPETSSTPRAISRGEFALGLKLALHESYPNWPSEFRVHSWRDLPRIRGSQVYPLHSNHRAFFHTFAGLRQARSRPRAAPPAPTRNHRGSFGVSRRRREKCFQIVILADVYLGENLFSAGDWEPQSLRGQAALSLRQVTGLVIVYPWGSYL